MNMDLRDDRNSELIVSRADLLLLRSIVTKDELCDVSHFAGYISDKKKTAKKTANKSNKEKTQKESGISPVVNRRDGPPLAFVDQRFYRVVAYDSFVEKSNQSTWQDQLKNAQPIPEDHLGTHPAPCLPLVSWSKIWPFLRAALGEQRVTHILDTKKIEHHISKQGPMHRLPFQKRLAWSPHGQLIFDFNSRIESLNEEFCDLKENIVQWRGGYGLDVKVMEGGPKHGWRDWGNEKDKLNVCSVPSTIRPVVIVSDLGYYDTTGHSRFHWLKLGRCYQQSGIKPVVLMPSRIGIDDAKLRQYYTLISWDRDGKFPTYLNGNALPSLAKRTVNVSESQHQLLGLLSPFIRIEPALLRGAARLLPSHKVTVDSEIMLWNHKDVISDANGFYFVAEDSVMELHRATFRSLPHSITIKIPELIIQYHSHLPKVIQYEEILNYFDLVETEPLLYPLNDNLKNLKQEAVEYLEKIAGTLYQSQLGQTPDNVSVTSVSLWGRRFSDRFKPGVWNTPEACAVYAFVHQDDIDSGNVAFPTGLDMEKVRPFMELDNVGEFRSLQLFQVGTRLILGQKNNNELQPRGSCLATLHLDTCYIGVEQHKEGETLQSNYYLDSDQGEFQLKNSDQISLKTRTESITIESITKPDWATQIAIDQQGLFCDWYYQDTLQQEKITQRNRWINPGKWIMNSQLTESDSVSSPNQKEVVLKKGFWLSESILKKPNDPISFDNFEKPSWATQISFDQYGLYCEWEYFNKNSSQIITQRMRWINPGKFLMGSPESELDRESNEQQHEVIISQGYWLADTACTQALWEAVMEQNPSYFNGNEKPVENISWDDTQDFITRLNKGVRGLQLRLPTEAEWEYACRAGTTTAFSFGDNITPEQVNYDGSNPYAGANKGIYREKTVEVKSLPPNQWGLYEMHGNVWEWCEDWFQNEYDQEQKLDPKGPLDGAARVLRGGSWLDRGWSARSARRRANAPDARSGHIGLRLAQGQ